MIILNVSPMGNIDHRKLAEIFTDTLHHKTVAEIVRAYSTNKLDVRNVALEGLQLQNSKIVLDIACGFGFFTLALKDRLNPGSQILGIDLCKKYKSSYLESCKVAGLQGRFSSLDKETLNSIPVNSVDLIICSYALYFFPEFIPKISRVLKPSGLFVIITHSENHIKEIIAFLKDTFKIAGIQIPDLFPCQTLIDDFNNLNGYRLLSPYFGQIDEKEYRNSLCFEINDFEDLEKYFRFKQPYYIPDYLDNKDMVFNKMISRLREQLQSGIPFSITKDDTIFICKEPLPNK